MRGRVWAGAIALLLTAACAAPPAPVVTAAGPTTFHDPIHGVAFQLPASWRCVDAGETMRFEGPDGQLAIGAVGVGDHETVVVDGRSLQLWGDAAHLPAIARSVHGDRDGLGYARGVLNLLEAFHYRRAEIDWPAVETRVEAAAASAATPAEALPALRLVTSGLGESHSAYFDAATWKATTAAHAPSYGYDAVTTGGRTLVARVRPGSPAEAVGMLPGDAVTDFAIADLATNTATLRLARPGVAGERSVTLRPVETARSVMSTMRLLDGAIAYLEVPGYVELDPERAYYTELSRLVASARAAGVKGWILDVRRNGGGLYQEMLSGLVPMIGDGRLGGSASAGGVTAIDYALGGELYSATPAELPALTPGNPPVAVLTSPMTASAGERLAAAFAGKPHTRRFGEPTAGLLTQMRGFTLWDGAYLNVAVARAIDAAGEAHDGPMSPEEAIATTFVAFGTDADPVLQRAHTWLAENE